MGKKVILLFSVFLLVLTSLSFISAQEETGGFYSKQGAEYMDNGVIVNTLTYDTAQLNRDLYIYMTPYEQSGKTLDNGSVSCRFGIISPHGERLLLMSDDLGNFTHISEDDIWIGIIPGEFLNESGAYLYNWDCQKTVTGGYLNGFIEVNPTGHDLREPEAILYIGIIIALIIFLIVTVYGAIAIPYRNERNDDGKIISVNDKKYLKILSIFASYGILTWLANIMISISNHYINIDISLTFFTIIFKLLISLLYPTLIFTIIFIAIQFVKDMKLNKMIDRGILG